MEINVLRSDDAIKQSASQIAMYCKSNLRMSTTLDQLLNWAHDSGLDRLEFQIINPVNYRLTFTNANFGVSFSVKG